ncbi:hypothetical protein DACRYDRAFT_19597 [Dacryopinax primogenitus]|uniref:Uncharacterized protein n=1 Tax=Dacryopinax primogenitus (strain DJM 731) TaxID=1858805 RepID=M5GCU7_DACPD|nr:uncharacterized protein DACRYDRAFT_19597 [Dacryopinax primogenitus]EJU06435.1 hypothetical protein DACRYDRAFT_19597 [Dacryopinax primogenitus]
MLPLLLLSLLSPVTAVEVYHRIQLPSSPSTWSHRGTIDLSSVPASYAPAPDGSVLSTTTGEDAIYQVALALEGRAEDDWPFAGVKACFAAAAKEDTITLRLSASGEPYTLSYALDPAPSAHCPVTSSSLGLQNTSIVLHLPDRIPPLALKTPPQLSEEGEAIKPEPEKSLIQKYWMYLLPVMLLLLMAPGGEQQGGGGGGQ